MTAPTGSNTGAIKQMKDKVEGWQWLESSTGAIFGFK
jgi:hypothetical protein